MNPASSPIRIAVVGAGAFGRNHLRVLRESGRVAIAAVVDTDPARAGAAAAEYGCAALTDHRRLEGMVDAAVVAVPTVAHTEVGCDLLEAGIALLIEKPIAHDPASARKLAGVARRKGLPLQVGHLERFNPAVIALRKALTLPLFFEVHRLSVFTPRSLDVDVVMDLMIHDIDIVLSLVGELPEEVRAAGISVLSPKVDIASARLAFSTGCIANFTASRVSTERVRKLRLFQPSQYITVDYSRQDALSFSVDPGRQIGFRPLPVEKAEPLRLEIESFLDCLQTGRPPEVDAEQACRALEVAAAILAKIEEHSRVVAQSLAKVAGGRE